MNEIGRRLFRVFTITSNSWKATDTEILSKVEKHSKYQF